MKIYQVLSCLSLNNVGRNLRKGTFESDIGIGNIHTSKGTHWVAYINEIYIDKYGCGPRNELSKFFIKRNGYCLYFEYKIQCLTSKRDSFCAAYCFYRIYLTKVLEVDFKSAVFNLYYQTIS